MEPTETRLMERADTRWKATSSQHGTTEQSIIEFEDDDEDISPHGPESKTRKNDGPVKGKNACSMGFLREIFLCMLYDRVE